MKFKISIFCYLFTLSVAHAESFDVSATAHLAEGVYAYPETSLNFGTILNNNTVENDAVGIFVNEYTGSESSSDDSRALIVEPGHSGKFFISAPVGTTVTLTCPNNVMLTDVDNSANKTYADTFYLSATGEGLSESVDHFKCVYGKSVSFTSSEPKEFLLGGLLPIFRDVDGHYVGAVPITIATGG